MVRRLSRKAPDEFAVDDWVPLLATRTAIVWNIDVSIAGYIGQRWRLIPALWRRRLARNHWCYADGVVAQVEFVARHEKVVDDEMLPARIYQVLPNCALEVKHGLPTGGVVLTAHSAGDDENCRREEPESQQG